MNELIKSVETNGNALTLEDSLLKSLTPDELIIAKQLLLYKGFFGASIRMKCYIMRIFDDDSRKGLIDASTATDRINEYDTMSEGIEKRLFNQYLGAIYEIGERLGISKERTNEIKDKIYEKETKL